MAFAVTYMYQYVLGSEYWAQPCWDEIPSQPPPISSIASGPESLPKKPVCPSHSPWSVLIGWMACGTMKASRKRRITPDARSSSPKSRGVVLAPPGLFAPPILRESLHAFPYPPHLLPHHTPNSSSFFLLSFPSYSSSSRCQYTSPLTWKTQSRTYWMGTLSSRQRAAMAYHSLRFAVGLPPHDHITKPTRTNRGYLQCRRKASCSGFCARKPSVMHQRTVNYVPSRLASSISKGTTHHSVRSGPQRSSNETHASEPRLAVVLIGSVSTQPIQTILTSSLTYTRP
jgi:hypothetical protein